MSNDTIKLNFDDSHLANALFGPQASHLRRLEELSGLRIAHRGLNVQLEGDKTQLDVVSNLLSQCYELLRSGSALHERDIESAYAALALNHGTRLNQLFHESIHIGSPRRNIVPKSMNQHDYVLALREKEMVFGVGPAGTGKTYLAVAVALSMLLSRKVKRIVLTRPAVEAGEKLGFLPGDLAEKVNPYLRPLYDALHDMLDFNKVDEMLESGIIEVAPLAFMRGRTLNDSFVILDEAQNTTPEQMKMFLTRMGFGSRMAVTGDITQIDLPQNSDGERSGLVQALRVLSGVPDIAMVHFQKEDVIRHPLVARIVDAYDKQ